MLNITFTASSDLVDDLAFIGATLIGQLIGFFHSLYLGLHPDNPSVSGSISRVVKGVTIYRDVLLHEL